MNTIPRKESPEEIEAEKRRQQELRARDVQAGALSRVAGELEAMLLQPVDLTVYSRLRVKLQRLATSLNSAVLNSLEREQNRGTSVTLQREVQ